MRNQLRADFYKLRHSSVFWITGGVVILLFLGLCMMANGSDSFYMGYGREYVDNVPILEGFVAFAYEDPLQPAMWEVVYSATALTFVLWIVLLVLAVLFYSNEFSTGTIKLSIAYGKNRLMIFFSKLIVIVAYFGILYYAFHLLGYVVSAKSAGIAVTSEGILAVLKLTTLFYMVLIIFTMICMLLYTIFQNTVLVSTIMIAYMYSVIFMILGIMDGKVSPVLQFYFNCNPMYYLWKGSGFWAYPDITKSIIQYFIFGFITLTIAMYYVQMKREIK